jgi:type VI secretion system secreted protein Hcp
MAVDMFLKLDGIQGESLDDKHRGEIEILSFSWGVSQQGSFGSGGGGAGKVSVHDISFTKRIDKSSPLLMKSCATGTHIKEGLITVRKAGDKPVEYLKIKLVDILISSIQMDGHSNGTPGDAVALDFKKATFSYFLGGIAYSATVENFEQGQAEPPPAPPA